MSSPQKEEYLRIQAERAQRKQKAAEQKKPETAEEAALRWRKWRNIAVFSVAGIVLAYYAWIYLVPLVKQRVVPPTPMEEASIAEVVAEFNEDGDAAEKKYGNHRIIVEGKFVADPKGMYFELPGEEGEDARVPCEFFDPDDAQSVDSGDAVKLSGVIKRIGPKKIKLVGASRQ